MAPPLFDTPRTEVADQTRLTGMDDLDFSTENSIPSPSKEGHNLLMQIRSIRGANVRTPRASRVPLGERRNVPSKAEFTPLLKSATRNSFAKSKSYDKENSQLQTPAGLRASYRADSPVLPFNSSVIIEEHTASSVVGDEDHSTPMIPVSSSSVLSTPLAILQTRGEGPLNGGGNLATLREQEARLEQIDKENFGLKLKIHFLEEALRKSGTEFNEAAVKENTELKVDKVTLQRDLKNYRKCLAQAEKDLEDYRRQLLDYAEKMKRRHASETSQEELEKLRQLIADKDRQIAALEAKVMSSDDQNEPLQTLQDEISDLQAEIRQKDMEIEGKDDELNDLRAQISKSSDGGSEKQLEEKNRLLEEKEDDLEGLRNALADIETEFQHKLKDKDQLLEAKDEELQQMEEEVKVLNQDQSFYRAKAAKETDEKSLQIQTLTQRLVEASESEETVKKVQEQLQMVESNLSSEIRKKSRFIEEKDFEIHSLTRKLETILSEQADSRKHLDDIQDLEAEGREKDRIIEEKEDELMQIRQQLQDADGLDEELMKAQDQIQELEMKQEQHLKDLQVLRGSSRESTAWENDVYERAQERILELEAQQQFSRRHERQLEDDLNKVQSQLRSAQAESESKKSLVTTAQQSLESAHSALKAEKAQAALDRKSWEQIRSESEVKNERAEEKIKSLERAISELQTAGASPSDYETHLKDLLEKERKASSTEKDSLREQLASLKQDAYQHLQSLEETRLELEQARKELLETKDEADNLQDKIESLEDEVEILQTGFEEAEQAGEALSAAKQKIKALEEQTQSANSAKARQALDKQLSELKLRLLTSETENQTLRDSASNFSSARENLQNVLSDAEAARDRAQNQCRDLRAQLQKRSEDSELKQQTRIKVYEQDIQGLERDLAHAQSRQADLIHAKEEAERQMSQLRSKVQSLESRATRRDAQSTGAQERQDLHEMLKDAKLEIEDLTLQIREQNSRIATAVSKENELRTQLKRVRDERVAQSARADTATKEAYQLQRKYDDAMEDLLALQRQQNTHLARGASSAAEEKRERRHAAELKGLIKQIEYLAARCRREESFRQDLSYVKTFFTRQVEMYGRCTAADLRLVRAMGIPTEVIRQDQVRREREKRTRSRDEHDRERPSLKVVALTILASVRMQRAAQKWSDVRKSHEGLLKKLNSMRKTSVNASQSSVEARLVKSSKVSVGGRNVGRGLDRKSNGRLVSGPRLSLRGES